MTQIETVQFSCPSCGKRLRAQAEQGGRIYACPGCGGPVPVPRVVQDAVPARVTTADTVVEAVPQSWVPKTLPELALALFVGWSALAFVCLVLAFFGEIARYVGIVLVLLATMVAAVEAWKILRARQRVIVEKDVSLLWGTFRLIAWDPTEGILILKDKAIHFSDDDLHDRKGGIRFLYPLLGEELVLRVPLEVQTLAFADSNVLTREYLHLSIRGSMKWRIDDIEKFYLLVSRELRTADDTQKAPLDRRLPAARDPNQTTNRLINAVIGWLRVIAEEQTRTVVSRVRSGLLIADKLIADVPAMRQMESGEAPADFGGATEGLAGAIHDAVAERLKDYGILVAEVSLQEIRMPEEIVRQCVDAAKTAYLPLMAKREAAKRHEELKADADVIGAAAVGAREVVSHTPAYALRDFLTEFVANKAPTITNGVAATIDVSKLSALANEPPAPLPPEAAGGAGETK